MQQIQRIGILTTQDAKEIIAEIISRFPKVPNTDFIYLYGEERTVTHSEIEILFIHRDVNRANFAAILKAHPNLKWVHTFTTGVQHLFVPQLVESPIQLTNAKNCFSQSLGEFVQLAMLYFNKLIPLFTKQKAQHLWKKTPVDVLKGKILTIIGYGDIGLEVAKRAKRGFEMKVIGVKKYPHQASEEAKSYADMILGNQQCNEALKAADFVCSILPGLESTYHYFDLTKFKQMKQTAIFISIGRGTVVKEEHLIQALEEKIIGGAALDVFEKEPLSPESKLWDFQNVMILPHNADYTSDQADLSYELFQKNLEAYMKGEALLTVVNKKKGY